MGSGRTGRRFAPLLGGLGLVGLIAIAYHGLVPDGVPRFGAEQPSFLTHLIAYAGVSAVLALAWQPVQPWRLGAFLIGFASLLEIAQLWSPGRVASFMDFAASAMGVVAGLAASWLLLVTVGSAPRAAGKR